MVDVIQSIDINLSFKINMMQIIIYNQAMNYHIRISIKRYVSIFKHIFHLESSRGKFCIFHIKVS